MADTANTRRGYASTDGRDKKARVIRAVLKTAGHPIASEHLILDIGTGSGQIAANLSHSGQLISCDIVDQRASALQVPFVRCAQALPFADNSFDRVISNHVIEHVDNPGLHLREIHRILKPDGVVYLATPNRLWPYEFHTRLWLLHYLPPLRFRRLARAFGKADESLLLQSTSRIRQDCQQLFRIEWQHPAMAANPQAYGLHLARWATRLARLTPRWLIQLTATLQPTLICLLHPK